MDRVLYVKLISIAIFVSATSYLFYDELFITNTKTMHQFGNVAFLVASISFGVILSASIYNLAFYFYMKSHQYLYYSLAQLSILFFLINLDSIFIAPFYEIFGLKSITLFCVAGVLVLIFSLLFIYEFLKDYQLKKINYLIKVILILAVIDLFFAIFFSFSLFTTFLFIPIWLILSEAHRTTKEKDLPFYFLLIGWYIAIFVATIEHLGFIKFIGVPFPFLHITFAIESIFLSLAISYKFKLVEEKQKTQQALLLQQSRLASMGEMISIIAHQWRQPLNILSVIHMNLNRSENREDSKMLVNEANKQISYMSNTIDSFRDFYNPTKEKKEFPVTEAFQNVLEIVAHALEISKIKISSEILNDFKIYGNRNEFEQVLLNIINNAKDALIKRDIENPIIKIKIDSTYISIEDNAKGIDKEHIEYIFNPYFTTKQGSDGIGLYISKMIIEQEMHGELTVISNQKGSIFTISINRYPI